MADRIYPEEKPLFTSPPSVPKHLQDQQFLYTPPPPPAYPLPPPPRRRRSSCCACLFAVFIAIIILVAIATLVFYLVVQPRAPKYTVQDVHIAKFDLNNQSSPSGGSYLTSDVTFTVNVRNPNRKMGIYYGDVDVTLSYEGEDIGSASIPSFYQGHKNTTVLVVRMEGQDKSLDEEAGSSLLSAINKRNSIFLRARIQGHIRVKIGRWKSRHAKLVVKCDVEISSPSSLGSEHVLSKKCKLHV